MAWNDKKLEELRAKYAGGHGGELFDPKFRKVADKIFSKSGTRVAPYAGVPTFLTAPYMPLDADKPDFGDLQVAMVGVPMDLGVTNRPGSRFGPRALRTIERIGPYNHVLDCAPVSTSGSPTSATFRSPAATGWSRAMTTSSGASTRSSAPAWCRFRSAATIRSPIRSSRRSARIARSA